MFCCPTYIHLSKRKLEPKAKICIFVGYDLGVKFIGCGMRILEHDNYIQGKDLTYKR